MKFFDCDFNTTEGIRNPVVDFACNPQQTKAKQGIEDERGKNSKSRDSAISNEGYKESQQNDRNREAKVNQNECFGGVHWV